MDLKSLFLDHLKARQRIAEEAMAVHKLESIVLSSGAPFTYFADDCDAPFRPTPHFHHVCPVGGPHHVLHLRPGQTPRLIRYAPEDFWYEQLPLGNPFWADGFEITDATSVDAVWEQLGEVKQAAYIGNETERAVAAGLPANPAGLTAFLDWHRSYKTPYEVACIDEAAKLAARGHQAARAAFLAGGSELDIHHAYVQAVGAQDHELAFPTIVAMNEKGATLHYENKRTLKPGLTLIMDAGARYQNYASDITRTHVAPGADPRFKALREGMERIELRLCGEAANGMPFGDLHHRTHLYLGALLKEAGILDADPEEAVQKGFTRIFLPHGLGHHLGIQVHDVAGKLAGPDGTLQPPPAAHPFLRTTRTIEPGHVLTIEPGLYFIPMLQRPFREGEHAGRFDWKLIDELAPCGGIRIEDDILMTESGPRNLTRPYLPE